MLELFSRRDDVTLANPLGPPHLGWGEVEKAIERADVHLAGSGDVAPISLRVTMIFRREGDAWRVSHRHADAITGPRDVSSIVEQSSS